MKKSEIAAKVFDTLNPLPLADVADGPLEAPVADLAALSLVPWFCDASVQWALRLTTPGSLLNWDWGSFESDSKTARSVGHNLIRPGTLHNCCKTSSELWWGDGRSNTPCLVFR